MTVRCEGDWCCVGDRSIRSVISLVNDQRQLGIVERTKRLVIGPVKQDDKTLLTDMVNDKQLKDRQ